MLPLSPTNAPRFRFTLLSALYGDRVLRADPRGWNELGLSLHRDPKTHGLTREYTLQLGFIKDGRAYLAAAYAAAGVEANVRLRVEQWDPNAFAWLPYHQGRINFTSAKFSALECQANVENEDFTQKFLNRDAVAVDLFGSTSVGGATGPLAPTATVELHSRTIIRRFEGEVAGPKPLALGPGVVFDDASRSQTFYFGYDKVTNEIGLQEIAGGFVSGNAYDAVPIFRVPDFGPYDVDLAAVVDISVREVESKNGVTFGKVDIKFHYRINGIPDTAVVLATSSLNSAAGRRSYTKRHTIEPRSFPGQPLKPGDEIFLYAEVYVHEIDSDFFGNYRFEVTADVQPGAYLRIRARTTTPSTLATGLLAYEALDRVCQALTDAPDAFRSDFFNRPDTRRPQPYDGPGALLLLTGGFQLRGFPLRNGLPGDKSLYATWRDLFDSLAALFGLGYAVEGADSGQPVVRVEPLAYFYPAAVVVDLTLPRGEEPAPSYEVTRKVAAERHYQLLEFGYPSWQAEQVNGLDEANAKRQWTTPLTTVRNAYTQLSKYSTSGQLLEVTRRLRYDDSDTTDTGRDNDNFLIALLRTPGGGLETERNQQFARLDGVLDPASSYNARYTPARNLLRHGAVVRAGLEPDSGQRVRFAFGEGNNAVVSRLLSETQPVAESGSFAVAELAPPLWLPVEDALRAPCSRAQVQALLAYPQGRVRYFDNAGRVCEGWILDFKHNAADQQADFTLLPCAS